MRVDEAGRDGAAVGVEPGEPRDRVAAALERLRTTLGRGPTARIRPSQQATTGAPAPGSADHAASSSAGSSCATPRRRPPAIVTISRRAVDQAGPASAVAGARPG